MSAGLLELVKIFWPFLKEQFLKNNTFREFVVHNKTALLLLVCLIVALFSQLHLFTISEKIGYRNAELVSENRQLRERLAYVNQRIIQTEANLSLEQSRTRTMSDELEDAIITKERYEQWFVGCGIRFEQDNMKLPRCPVNRRPMRPPARQPKPTAKPKAVPVSPTEPTDKPSFLQRIRNAFRRDKTSDDSHE